MLEIIILLITAILNIVLGLAVYIKNPRSVTNKFFLLLTAAIVIWSATNYISVHPVLFSQITWVRLVLFWATLLGLSIFLTLLAFPAPKLTDHAHKRVKWATIAAAFVMILTLTPFVFNHLALTNGKAEPVVAPGIGLFLIYTLTILSSSFYILIRKYRHSTGKTKNQLRLIIYGIAGTFSLIVLTNFLLVITLNITSLIPLGPAFTLIFSGSFAYAIIKHRLFDIRAAVARSMAYLLSLGTIVFIYSIIVFGVAETLLRSSSVPTFQRGFYIAFAVLTSFIYQPVKKFFDKLTNRIFFQDAYDPQLFIDQLNRTLVNDIELEPILRKTCGILEDNIKPEFSVFGIHKTRYTPSRNIGPRGLYEIGLDANALQRAMQHIHHHIILADELAEDVHHQELYRLLQTNNVALVVRLTATVQRNTETLGYLMLGPKKSGNAYTDQDVKMLSIVANELVIALENALHFEEIEKFNVTLQEKIQAATLQLRQTNDKLKALDETKDEFISMASHQLRTPLTSVKGYLSMVLEGDAGKITANQRKLLDQAFISSQRMVYLIADLLNVSRLRTGKFVIESVPTNLADAVQGEVEQLIETAKGRGLELTYDKPKEFPMLMLDETKLRQVIMNFTDNAIYYTPSGGHIKVELKDLDESVEFTVTDDGIGVPKHEQHNLFNKFYRAGNARKARPDGTGLGLFMAKKVIVAQGGNLIFKSLEGKGSTFGFAFAKSKLLPPKTA